MNRKAKYYIQKLQLQKHPEGGYYREIYRSGEMFYADKSPNRYKNSRSISTSIYFLLEGKDFSAFHKLKSDEIWHFYDGSNLKVYIIDPRGNLTVAVLGKQKNIENFQIVLPKNHWFAAELIDKKSFSLFGCTVAPGFDFKDFKLGKLEQLIERFPQHSKLFERLAIP